MISPTEIDRPALHWEQRVSPALDQASSLPQGLCFCSQCASFTSHTSQHLVSLLHWLEKEKQHPRNSCCMIVRVQAAHCGLHAANWVLTLHFISAGEQCRTGCTSTNSQDWKHLFNVYNPNISVGISNEFQDLSKLKTEVTQGAVEETGKHYIHIMQIGTCKQAQQNRETSCSYY